MNISLVIISDGWGGAETVVHELAKNLVKKGQEITIILNQEILKYYENIENVRIYNIGSVYNHKNLVTQILNLRTEKKEYELSSFPFSLTNEILRIIYFKQISNKLSDFFIKNNIEIVHTHLDNSHLLISEINYQKIKWVSTIHGARISQIRMENSTSFYKNLLTKINVNFDKYEAKKIGRTFGRMDKITFVSYWLEKIFLEYKYVNRKGEVIPNGIELPEFLKIINQRMPNRFNILFPGGVRSTKNPDLVVEAFHEIKEKIPNAYLYIAGNVPLDSHIRKIANRLNFGRNIEFTGHLSPKEYRILLSFMDVLVLPSKAESFGISLIEAMAMGKPVIATNRGGVPEIITNGENGILIEPNSKDIANSVLYMYENKELREEFARNNIKKVRNYDWDVITDKYIKLYQKV